MTTALRYVTVDSPLGDLLLVGDGRTLRGLYIQGGHTAATVPPHWEFDRLAFVGIAAQLVEYFAGERVAFEIPVMTCGTPFQQRVWKALHTIPCGTTISYGQLARRIGQPSAARAVGLANGRNPVSIVVPCHRVIGTNGTLTGYGGGLARKRKLLELEASTIGISPPGNAREP